MGDRILAFRVYPRSFRSLSFFAVGDGYGVDLEHCTGQHETMMMQSDIAYQLLLHLIVLVGSWKMSDYF